MKITGFRVSLWTHHHNHFWYLATSMRQKEENFKTALYTFKQHYASCAKKTKSVDCVVVEVPKQNHFRMMTNKMNVNRLQFDHHVFKKSRMAFNIHHRFCYLSAQKCHHKYTPKWWHTHALITFQWWIHLFYHFLPSLFVRMVRCFAYWWCLLCICIS